MTTIQLMACIGMVVGFFVLLGITPSDFTEGVFRQITSKPKSLRDEINESTQRKKKFVLRREIEESQNILRMTGREAKFPAICAMSLLLFLVGASFAFLLGNFFLVPVLAAGMMFIPFWYIKLTAAYFKKAISAELETALSIITTSYLRNEDIQTAVEENLEYLNPPVKNAFAEFLTRIKLVDPDVDAALRDLSTKIDNAVFREWVAALLTCRYDRGMEELPVISRLLEADARSLDRLQVQMATAREFFVLIRFRDDQDADFRTQLSRVQKSLEDQGFKVRLAGKEDAKRMLGVYFEQNATTEKYEDFDGERWIVLND